MIADSVERVGTKLVFTQENLQEIKDDTALNVAQFILAFAHLLGGKHCDPNGTGLILDPSDERKESSAQMSSPLQDVGNVKVLHVVAGDNVWINFLDKL